MMSSFFFLFITLVIIIQDSESYHYCYEVLPPEHGTVKVHESLRYYEFSCEDGYIMHGDTFIECHTYKPNKRPVCVEAVCEDLLHPQNGLVDCDESPLVPGKICRFSCLDGYKLEGTQKRICKFNFQWSGGPTTCSPIVEHSYSEPTDENSRLNGRTSVENLDQVIRHTNPPRRPVSGQSCQNLDCEQLCLLVKDRPQCKCCPGYKLNRKNNRTCTLYNARNVDMTACLQRYQRVGDVHVHPCPDGYIFDYHRKGCLEMLRQRPPATRPISPVENCSNRNGGCQHVCSMKDSKVVCECRDGYQLHVNGKNCIDINECNVNNFGCSDSCVNILGSAYCDCPKGYMLGADKKTCIDINECLYDNPCHHYCNNTEGSYFCTCKPSYILIEGYKCEGCRRDSYWSYESNGCVDCPRNSHTSSDGKTTLRDCVCNSGYAGNPGEYITCEDIDECHDNNFGCSDTCVNIPGSAYCICPKGFMLDFDNKTCIDIDECRIKNGGCEGLCMNTRGSFECFCPDGLVTSSTDRYSCDDINECSENNGGCEQECINYHGGFYCACKDGYRLDSTLKNCTDVQCPKLPQPHYSHMNCSNEAVKNNYPVGTVCSFSCEKGFKNTQSDRKLTCRRNGTWKGKLPECKPQSCPPLDIPEHGKVHPASCSTQGAPVKQKCTFSCHAGYILDGDPVFNCKNNLTWNKKDIPACELVKVQPIIECPEDIRVVLSKGESRYNVTIPEPSTNIENYEVHPSGVTVNEPVEFPVGETKVTFTAVSEFNETAKCEMTVTVLDEEAPIFHSCPDPIIIEGARGSGEFVTWDEPVVTDNVQLVSVFSLLEPNTTLTPGTYLVEYVARDSSGNIGTCSFDISVIRMNCSYLGDPDHGKANCMDWMFGKLCNPECDDGYMRDPIEPLYYSCDDTGVWEPSDSISECLKYTTTTTSTCPDGFELKKVDLTGEEACIECSSNAVWSATTRKCEK